MMKFILFVSLAVASVQAKSVSEIFQKDVVPKQFVPTRNPHKPSGRIVGGQVAEPHAFPYEAYLEFTGPGYWTCPGSLISPNYILTAGSCTYGATEVKVSLGINNIVNPEDTRIQIYSSTIITHEDYDDDGFLSNNIGLVKLPEPVTLDDNVQTVSLIGKDDMDNAHINDTLTISGWGATDQEQGPLYYIEQIIQENENCEYFDLYMHDYTFCTISVDQKNSPCGDSGAPVTIDGVLVAIHSFVIDGCYPTWNSGQLRIAAFVDWIVANSDIEG